MNSLISSGGGGMKYVLQAIQELELESHQMLLYKLMKKVSGILSILDSIIHQF